MLVLLTGDSGSDGVRWGCIPRC